MKKVLVVDDDPNIVEVLRLYFDKDGFAVTSCLSGDRALETFQSSQPDLTCHNLLQLQKPHRKTGSAHHLFYAVMLLCHYFSRIHHSI